ncbi:MAG: cobalamin-dependent protein [Lachnospiraceae bacterium]|nr:cobalamin-dependent protein [Lachnospiraceae bacterium]MDD3615186.1 cobalamin-dependent protein [Lachnospiraceae bacterium]
MSLFYIDEADELNELVQRMSKRQYEQSPGLYDELPERARKFMKRDFYYGISYLKSAMDLKEERVFISYVEWTYQYLSYLMTYVTKDKMTAQCKDFYAAMRECLKTELPQEKYSLASDYIQKGMETIDKISKKEVQVARELENRNEKSAVYEQIIADYISTILRKDSKTAMQYFLNLYQKGMRIDEIYLELVQKIMRKIGELWFENKISVAQEHYCTALTQTALSQLYSAIFSTPSNGHTMIGCCIGGELHEMGMRMITDLFTYEGWNSIFLGAGVPEEAVLAAVEDEKPDLVALSVTMPQHLMLCKDMVQKLRSKNPDIKIAIGGRAFTDIPNAWKNWKADVYTTDARGLIQWTKTSIR